MQQLPPIPLRKESESDLGYLGRTHTPADNGKRPARGSGCLWERCRRYRSKW